jgi:3-hydroxymyristoyl/3-hydroxydecanoyl-(acyl carrier protein) dehydratase
MAGRYAAFTFCDRITAYEPAKRARGLFHVPVRLEAFPACLVAEATGQLAAWVSMANIGFRGRPVAALAAETRFLGDAQPGDTLQLEVDIEQCDAESVAYSGAASVNGRKVLELVDAVAPMLPQDEYDAPDDLAAFFRRLLGEGAAVDRFPGVVPPPMTMLDLEHGESARASLAVPAAAPYFADHFPRRPVFPATLLLDSGIRLAVQVAETRAPWHGRAVAPARVTHVKMRDWILPGETVELRVEQQAASGESMRLALSAVRGDRTVATARVEIAAREQGGG